MLEQKKRIRLSVLTNINGDLFFFKKCVFSLSNLKKGTPFLFLFSDFDSNGLIGYTCTARIGMTRYSFGFWSIIRLCRKDGRVVEGVALELLCRLLFTEGSNPSLSFYVPSFIEFANVNVTNHNVSNKNGYHPFL